ncbi:acetaldehyde dehydrogenase (acetylating) [Streptomyces cacaoi]
MTHATTRRKARAAIVGPGNIGTDLLYKLLRSAYIEPRWMIGVDPDSEGLKRAAGLGLAVSHEGIDPLLAGPELPDLVFEATSAAVHRANAPRYAELGIQAVDLTPAKLGPAVVPAVNLDDGLEAPDVNLVTCGGQATIPMVHAVSRVVPVEYAEIVASVASPSAGPGTRANIDEFTRTTAWGIERIGGARRGKAIIILNPAEPPMLMRDTVFCAVPDDVDEAAVTASVRRTASAVAEYVPGYRLRGDPQFDPATDTSPARVAIFLEVAGAGDFLPEYAGNLDIMTAAATRVGEGIATRLAAADGPSPSSAPTAPASSTARA